MAATLWLSWRDHVSLTPGDGEATIVGPRGRIRLRPIDREIAAAMERLAPPGADEESLAESVLAHGNCDSLARWLYHVDQLHREGLITRSLRVNGTLMASLELLNGSLSDASRKKREMKHVPVMLSRFAYLRREGSALVLESPLSRARVIFHDSRGIAVVATLNTPVLPEDLVQRFPESDLDAIQALLVALDDAEMLDHITDNAHADDPDPALECWEFHDLLFHARSRRGRSAGNFGGTFRFVGRRPAPAVLVAHEDLDWHELDPLDPVELERRDPPFGKVQRGRRSIRVYGEQPLTRAELGEFLFRVARVTETWQSEMATPAGSIALDFATRPYPSGGALYELDFFLAVQQCRGLSGGLYYYDPQRHRLGRKNASDRDLALLIQDAAASAGIAVGTVQVLVILAPRFERLMWKYESIAYALLLKNVGVVYQTMYLAATAMNLAPCALGCGDSDLFARATGGNYYVQTSVGELLLGSKPEVSIS